MAGIVNILRNYEFLNLSKSVTEAQMALYKEPNQTWAQIGNKWIRVCVYNIEAPFAVGADVVAYFALSMLRSCNLFLPHPPAPPIFPIAHDNVEFITYAVERALWNWDPTTKKELKDGIEEGLSDQWNVYQVVGEWSMAYTLENAKKSNHYQPTFLTISEPLDNGETYRSVSLAFGRLWSSDQRAILHALYRQQAPVSLSFYGKKVYQNIRALASKLHQGNQNYLMAYSAYMKKMETGAASVVMPSEPTLVRPPSRAIPAPSAPPAPMEHRFDERQMAADVSFLRRALMNAIGVYDVNERKRIIQRVIHDTSRPWTSWHPQDRLAAQPMEASIKYFVARLFVLRFFKEGFQKNRFADCPDSFSLNDRLASGKTARQAGQEFAQLSDHDFTRLQEAIVNPARTNLSGYLLEKLCELSEFADRFHRNADFLKIYEALQIDLMVD